MNITSKFTDTIMETEEIFKSNNIYFKYKFEMEHNDTIDYILNQYDLCIKQNDINPNISPCGKQMHILSQNIEVFGQFIRTKELELKTVSVEYNFLKHNVAYIYIKTIFCFICENKMVELMDILILLNIDDIDVKIKSYIYNLMGYFNVCMEQSPVMYYEKAIFYYRKNINAIFNIANYYDKIGNRILMKKYYLKAIKKKHILSMVYLGYYYQYKKKNYKSMIKYYTMAITYRNATAMIEMGNYYKNVLNNIDLMEKYYIMAIDIKNSPQAMKLLIKHFEYNSKDNNKNNNKDNNKDNNNNQFKNKIKLYNTLIKYIDKNNHMINDTIKELKKDKNIMIYNSKLALAIKFNIKDNCIICLNKDVYQLDMGCGHTICYECYTPNIKCYYNFCIN